jgi:hypothetical protein
MDRKLIKFVIEDLLPRIVRELKLKHRECAERYGVFFDSMQEVFAREFSSDPEGTLKRYISLCDEECAWERGDFRTRDLLLDNFIGREIARAVRRELEKLGYYEETLYITWEDFKRLPELLRKNFKLKREVERLKQKLNEAKQENRFLREELEKVIKDGSLNNLRRKRAEELEGELNKLRQKCKLLENRLIALSIAPRAKKLAEMALILRAALRYGHATPAMLVKETKLKRYKLQVLLKELISLNLMVKHAHGFYTPAVDSEEEIELAIARRMVQRWMKSG